MCQTVLSISSQPRGVRELFLETFGYAVLSAHSGRGGIELLRQRTVNIIVLDDVVAGMDGEQIARELRKIAPRIPIVMVASRASSASDERLVDAFVRKAQEPGQMLSVLEEVTGLQAPGVRPRRPRRRVASPLFLHKPAEAGHGRARGAQRA